MTPGWHAAPANGFVKCPGHRTRGEPCGKAIHQAPIDRPLFFRLTPGRHAAQLTEPGHTAVRCDRCGAWVELALDLQPDVIAALCALLLPRAG
jgi:hypothetical protein